jgi:hypothetical protein
MHPHGVDIGPVEKRFVGAWVIGPDALDEFILPEELARLALAGRRRSRRNGCGR